MIVVRCQVGVSATDRSLVQRSPAECGVSDCDRGTSAVMRPRPTRAVEPWGGDWCLNWLRLYCEYENKSFCQDSGSSLRRKVQTCCKMHSTSYSLGTTGGFPDIRLPGREGDQSPQASAEVNDWSYV